MCETGNHRTDPGVLLVTATGIAPGGYTGKSENKVFG